MRPAGRAATESLYFNYPQFPAPALPGEPTSPSPVVIVGAGPVGMTAALTLARWGVPCLLLDNKSTFNDGSRAICLARQSFHIFESVGVVDAFLGKSLPYLSGRSFYRGQQILQFFMPDGPDHKYRPMYNLQQQYTEAFLYEEVARQPLIEVRWQSEVVDVQQDSSSVTLTVQDPQGIYTLQATWLLAADGARSVVRSRRGLRLKGQNFEGRYIIADIQMKRAPQGKHRAVERLALFDPNCRRGGTVLVHEQPDNIWRIDYQVSAGESEDEALQEGAIKHSISGVLTDLGWTEPWELEWWSIYSANTLALDDYRDGRIFFIGDSAHIVPIFGVRGLNNGLADAQNIGWKLAMVLRGQAGPGLLDSYSPERHGATMDVFANASKSSSFMTPQSRGWSLMRDAALSLALRHPFAGEFANPRNMTPYIYADSPSVTPETAVWSCGPAVGAVAQNLKLDAGFLSDQFGPGFTLLCFGTPSITLDHPSVSVVPLDPEGQVARVYGAEAGSAYLIRPDMHVAARWHQMQATEVLAALNRALGRGDTAVQSSH
jgi:3-(3-hydroxy-phenyl)propionate hydroxylase